MAISKTSTSLGIFHTATGSCRQIVATGSMEEIESMTFSPREDISVVAGRSKESLHETVGQIWTLKDLWLAVALPIFHSVFT